MAYINFMARNKLVNQEEEENSCEKETKQFHVLAEIRNQSITYTMRLILEG